MQHPLLGQWFVRLRGYAQGHSLLRYSAMGNQTYHKRQKELARLQKQKDKAARRIERMARKVKGGTPLEDDPMVDKAISEPGHKRF